MTGAALASWLSWAALALAVISALASLAMVATRNAGRALTLALNAAAWAVIAWAILQFAS